MKEKAPLGNPFIEEQRGGRPTGPCDHCYHTPVLKSRTKASIRVPRMFNHTHSNNMINR
jgi:hypothetical protein